MYIILRLLNYIYNTPIVFDESERNFSAYIAQPLPCAVCVTFGL